MKVTIDVGEPDWPASDLGLRGTVLEWALDEAAEIIKRARRSPAAEIPGSVTVDEPGRRR